MILLIRFILVSIIIYLLLKSFVRYFNDPQPDEKIHGDNSKKDARSKGVSKEIGEYVDYEEVDKKKK
jgi:hypothetical protein